jgi:hypothetical protein
MKQTEYCKDMRGNAIGAVHGCPFTSIDTISFATMMKEYFIPGLWDCGSNLYQYLYSASLSRVT